MRVPFLRLLLVGGGAVVLATAGFAYMASNTIATSSSGEGTGAVTGYTVSGISFSVDYQNSAPHHDTAVSFTLTSDSNLAGANLQPQDLLVQFVEGASYGPKAMLNPPINTPKCSFTGAGWTIGGSGYGTGHVFCDFSPGGASEPLTSSVTGLNVEANQ